MQFHPIGNGSLCARIPQEFAALLDALQSSGATSDTLRCLTDVEWVKLFELCDLAHLTLPLAQVEMTDFPEWVVARLKKNLSDNSLRFSRVRSSYEEAAIALEQAGVDHLVLKGFTQSPHYVRDPRLRMQSDLDLYCPADQIDHARKALEEIGYKPVGGLDYGAADHIPTLSRPGSWSWQGNPFDPEMPVSIELHHCLWNERVSFIAAEEVESFWNRREVRSGDAFSFPALSRVDQLGYFSLHILRGIIGGDWIVHHVREMASFLHLHCGDVEFWKAWEAEHSPRFRNLQAIAFSLAERWFSCTLSDAVHAQIESLPQLQSIWIERFGASSLEGMFRHTRDGRLLQVLLADSRPARRLVIRRAIIPASILGPSGIAALIVNRRQVNFLNGNRFLARCASRCRRIPAGAQSILRFLVHGVGLWFIQKTPGNQFWLFLCASFFLTWACRHIFSFSILF